MGCARLDCRSEITLGAIVRSWPEREGIEFPLLRRFEGISGPDADIIDPHNDVCGWLDVIHIG
jgi:hypothetical protein